MHVAVILAGDVIERGRGEESVHVVGYKKAIKQRNMHNKKPKY